MIKLFGRTKAPVILQLSNTECGIASLAMLFAYYKVNIPIEELRDQCGASRDGCKVETLLKVANQYGFEATAYTIDVDTVSKLTEPVIAHWKFSHFVVINYVANNKVSINDPAQGRIDIDMQEFDRSFTGVIININPTKMIIKSRKKHSTLKLFTSWLSDYYIEIGFLLLCLITITITPYLNSQIYNFFIDQYIISKNNSFMPHILILSVFLSIILISSSYTSKCVEFKLTTKASLLKSSKIILHVLKLPMIFYSLRQRSEIISVISRIETVINSLINSSIKMMAGLITTFICILLMVKIDYFLAIFSISTILIFILIFFILSKIILNLEKSQVNIHGKLHSNLASSMQNIETIKACSLEEKLYDTWKNLFFRKINGLTKTSKIKILSSVLINSYNLVLLFLILCIGSTRMLNGFITIGNLMSYYFLNLFCNTSIASCLKCLIEIQSVHAQHMRINDILLYNTDPRFEPKNTTLPNKMDSNKIIACNNVKFYYNVNNEPTLDNINIQIYRNQHVAFIGSTGSGKSTLIKLLCALYQPSQGEIIVFDQPLSNYSASELASMFAYVAQEVTLFSGTLLENLTLWRQNIPLEDIYAAINTACLSELIADRGLHAVVDEDGKNFSGGERQRLNIARALLQNTPILILDEATSALDYQTEEKLISNLKRINKTIIFIAHRLSSIKHCDQIFTLHNRKIMTHA